MAVEAHDVILDPFRQAFMQGAKLDRGMCFAAVNTVEGVDVVSKAKILALLRCMKLPEPGGRMM